MNPITINNQTLPIKEYKGQRVVTFKDIDLQSVIIWDEERRTECFTSRPKSPSVATRLSAAR